MNYRARIAPSPSGTLHLGNAKTALFNYLFSKKNNSSFILRIEDTDQSRAVKGGADNILTDLAWLGIGPNMGYGTDNKPAGTYTQMERLTSYQKIANQLIESGLAYRCYCSQEELDAQRAEITGNDSKAFFKYPGTCRSIKEILDKPYVIRFKATTEGNIQFEDVAFGKRTMPNKENYDFVIMRANGIPLYNFAVVVDDGITDNISHVIRGSDHIKNVSQQVLLYQALGLKLPVLCHLPMLLNRGGGKLSKRDGSVSVADFRAKGYSPAAILNYLVRFGWGSGNQEIFSFDEMVEKFKLEDCHCRDGKFDPVKFATINYTHLKSEALTSNDRYAELMLPILAAKDVNTSKEQLLPYISVVRSRAKTFVEAAELIKPMLLDSIDLNNNMLTSMFTNKTTEYLKSLIVLFESIETWTETCLRDKVNMWLTRENLTLKDIGAPLRMALLGQSNSPELFQVLHVMGRSKSLKRLSRAIAQLKNTQ